MTPLIGAERFARQSLAALPSGPALHDAPRVAPPPAMRATVARALALARALGLRLTGLRGVRYVAAPAGSPFGETIEHADHTLAIVLNVTMPAGEVARVTLHEAQHVADAHLDLERDLLEARAIEFSEAVCRYHAAELAAP